MHADTSSVILRPLVYSAERSNRVDGQTVCETEAIIAATYMPSGFTGFACQRRYEHVRSILNQMQ